MLRVIGGTLSGRRLAAPKGRHTRPTSDKVREGIFGSLESLIPLDGAHVLDLFAGSGALGIEALSRGAAFCDFVEAHARTAAVIRSNLEALGLTRASARVVVARAESWLNHPRVAAPVTLALLDPPYQFRDYGAVLGRLAAAPWIGHGAAIVVEAARAQKLEPPTGLEPIRTKRYGDTQVWYFRKVL